MMNDHGVRLPQQRIVITGMGVISTIGKSVSQYLESLRCGRSGITHWKIPDANGYSKIGGDMSDFDLKNYWERSNVNYPESLVKRAGKLLRTSPLATQMTAAAAMQAFVDARLADAPTVAPDRIGHVLAGHNLNARYIYDNAMIFQQEPEYIDPLYGVFFLDTDILAVITQMLNLRGPAFTVGGACASGNLALLTALDLLRAGRADAMLVSGGAIPLDPVTRQGWSMIDALSIRSFNDQPQAASRPFDRCREGFVPSEGAGVVVLETLENALRRGALIHAELLGACSTANASRTTKPDLDAQVRVMCGAMQDANIVPNQVDYINAHATSTPIGDAIEVQAIKAAFSDHAYRIPVNATKSMIGHCLTSAAIMELIATILQMQNNFVHPTINLTTPDPDLDLDFVPQEARSHQTNIAVSNAFGFGGLNACVIVGKSVESG